MSVKPLVIGILQSSYLPWLGYFDQIARSDVFVIYDDVQFEKGSWRNRNRIKTSQGIKWLTVPVLTKGKALPLINQVRINNVDHWQRKHIKTLEQNYRKSEYFETYAGDLFQILECKWELLTDLNLTLIKWFMSVLGINTKLVMSSDLNIEGYGTSRLIEIIKYLGGTSFYEGAAGKNYIEENLFESEGIQIVYQEYEHPTYTQLFEGFMPYLSVIDLIFNNGPEGLEIIMEKR